MGFHTSATVCGWHWTYPLLSSFRHWCFRDLHTFHRNLIIWSFNPSKTELPNHQDHHQHQDLLISLDNSPINPCCNHGQSAVLLTSHLMPVSPLYHQHDSSISMCRCHSGACSALHHFGAGLLQLTPGRAASTHCLSFATDPECSCMNWFQPSQDLPHHTTPHWCLHTKQKKKGSNLPSSNVYYTILCTMCPPIL